MRTSTILFIGLFTSLHLVACGGDDDKEGSSGKAASAQTVVERCSDVLSCTYGGETSAVTLQRHDGVCYAGQVRLEAGGQAVANGMSAEWKATSSGLDVCSDGDCFHCAAPTPAPSASSAGPTSVPAGKCTGVPMSCYGLGESTCDDQRGCSGNEHVRWDGDLEFECSGTARECELFVSQDRCEKQGGCHWQ
jgi:hypothetical protein